MLPLRLQRLFDLLAKLPGVGEKTAARYGLFLAIADPAYVADLARELSTLRDTIRACRKCGFLADATLSEDPTLCRICTDTRRDPSLLCVVGRVQDLLAFERSGAMRGRYFILPRLLSPLDGIGPEDMALDALTARIHEDTVKEIILATPPTVEGEATALFLARELGKPGIHVTRIASGVPHGGDLEFADQITLGRALEGRRPME